MNLHIPPKVFAFSSPTNIKDDTKNKQDFL